MRQPSFMDSRSGAAGRTLSLLIALPVVNVVLLAPHWLLPGGAGAAWLALEAVVVAGVSAALPRTRWSVALAAGGAAALVLASLLMCAEVVVQQSLGRPLNLYLDLHLVGSVYRLTTGAFGLARALLLLAGGALAVAAAVWLVAAALAPARGAPPGRLPAGGIVVAAVAVAGLAGHAPPALEQRTAWPLVEVATAQAHHLARMVREREAFEAVIGAAPVDYADVPGLLSRLRDRDVLLAFVESYGISALDDPRYAPVMRPRLDELEARAAAAGLHLATGTLVAPTQGGQSWFSHLSLTSGLWVDNQLRYDLLVASGRETLIDDFRRAGHRTVALMPANTLAWPEGERLGYDLILARKDIDYRGPPLNWVTMPDQFTWSYLERVVRGSARDTRPLFAELGLISSHAPWTPILPVLDDWEGIGDGAVFGRWRDAGESPEELWLDHDRVREHFALAVDYALNVVTGYAERYVDDRTLLIVLGDHQPAPLVTGAGASRAVPVHVLSGDAALIAPFLDRGYAPGAWPDPTRPPARMDTFRDWFVRAFSAPVSGAGAAGE